MSTYMSSRRLVTSSHHRSVGVYECVHLVVECMYPLCILLFVYVTRGSCVMRTANCVYHLFASLLFVFNNIVIRHVVETLQ